MGAPRIAAETTGRRRARFAVWADAALSVLFPPRCVHCGAFEAYLCEACREELTPLTPDVCRRCGSPRQATASCPECLPAGFAFSAARSGFLYQGPARSLVAGCKGGGLRAALATMADLSQGAFEDLVASTGAPPGALLVTWVPAHASLDRTRGYNHAEIYARGLAERVGARALPLVRKVRPTARQHGLDRRGRRSNLSGAFVPMELGDPRAGETRPQGVIIVDDVYTTGVTVSEVCAVAARAAGGAPAYAFTFARTPGGGGITVD